MKSRINGCRKYQRDEKTQEIEDIIFLYPESFLKKINNNEYNIPLNKNEIICEFIIKDKLGEGAFGSVRLGINKQTGEKVAIKILEKSKIKKIEDKIKFDREIEILKKLKHPNLVQLYCVVETEKQIYLIMEYIQGKELFQYILLKKKLSESEACFYFQQIVSGIEYLQKLKIAHRDIKSENMIIEQKTNNLKIFDFGLSNTYGDKPNEMLSTACGSPCYTAPEMLCGKIYKGKGVDIWSMGVVLFSMIFGFLPFHEESNKEMYKKIIEGKFEIPASVSKTGRELIYRLLNTNPKKRINISQIKSNSWIKLYSNGLNKEGKSLFNDGLLINKYVIPIDEEIIDEMEKYFEIPKIKSRNEILLNNSNDYTSLYYLLVNKKINSGKNSVSDFKSELFLSYIEDKKNLLSNYENNIEKAATIRKNGVLFEQEKLDKEIRKNLFGLDSNRSIKSQDNIYNIYFKSNQENKNMIFTTYNSSLSIKNNSNKKIINQKINIILNKNKNTNLFKKNINSITERKKESNNEGNIKDISTPKTKRNKKNLILKSVFNNNKNNKRIQQKVLDLSKSEKKYKTNSFITVNKISLSPVVKKIKLFQIDSKCLKRIQKKSSESDIKRGNKKLNKKQININKILKYSNDEIEERQYSKSIEDKKDKYFNKMENYKQNNEDKEGKQNLNIIKININEKKFHDNMENNTQIATNELSYKKNNIKYKETISPVIETQKSIINNTLENNKYNYFKSLDSFSLQTINQYDSPENNKNKYKLELISMNTFTEKEPILDSKTSRKKCFLPCKNNKNLKNKQNTNKLLKKNNKIISKNEVKNSKDKNLFNSAIKNIIKKIIIVDNNKCPYTNRNLKTYKQDKYLSNNNGITDNFKKISKDNNIENMTTSNTIKIINKNLEKGKLTKYDNRNTNLLSYNKSSSISNYNKDINKIINNLKIENSNSVNIIKNKNNIINKKSEENDKKRNIKFIKEKKLNIITKTNKMKYYNMKRINTANTDIKKNTNNDKLNRNNQLSISSFKISTLKNKEKKNDDNKEEEKNKNKKDLRGIYLYNNLHECNKKVKKSEFDIKNKNFLNKKNESKQKVNLLIDDLEPFDLNCIFSSPIKTLKKKLLKILEELKYKIQKIHSNKFIISYGEIENVNIYEINILKKNFNYIKFFKIQGINKLYNSDIRKIIFKIRAK